MLTKSFEIGAEYAAKTNQTIYSHEDLYIKAFQLSKYDRIEIDINNRLRVYLRQNFFYQIPEGDIKYETGTNPFSYLASQQAYDIIPKPEACSYLETTHNIRTNGIVIGSNIETHSFLLNDLGNNVNIMDSRLDDLADKEEEDRKLIDELNNRIK